MAVARRLVELHESAVVEEGLNPFDRRGVECLLDTPAVSAVAAEPATNQNASGDDVVRIALQALSIQRHELLRSQVHAEFVATVPVGFPGGVRSTDEVIRDMIYPGAQEVIIVGYEVSDRGIISHLAARAQSGTQFLLICDRGRQSAWQVKDEWPAWAPTPRLFEDRAWPRSAPYSSMHAKCVLVDNEDLLISSANFTFHGLHGNIEMGVRLKGPAVRGARRIFSHLVEAGFVQEIV